MEQINAFVKCDITKLNFPLRPFKAAQGHSFVAKFENVPADITGLYVRIFKENGSYYDVSGKELPDGWIVRIPAACFAVAGEFKYEVHAFSRDDEPCAIGEGAVSVAPWSYTTDPVPVGTVQDVAQIPCENGGFVQVVMKWDGFEWMPQAIVQEQNQTQGE